MHDQIVEKLRIERHTQRFTLKELSEKSGVSKKHICSIENGKTSPSLEILQKLADALGVEIGIVYDKKIVPK